MDDDHRFITNNRFFDFGDNQESGLFTRPSGEAPDLAWLVGGIHRFPKDGRWFYLATDDSTQKYG